MDFFVKAVLISALDLLITDHEVILFSPRHEQEADLFK